MLTNPVSTAAAVAAPNAVACAASSASAETGSEKVGQPATAVHAVTVRPRASVVRHCWGHSSAATATATAIAEAMLTAVLRLNNPCSPVPER